MTLDALTPASVHSLWSSPKCLNRLCLTVFSSLQSSLLLVHIFLTNFFLPFNFAFNILWYSTPWTATSFSNDPLWLTLFEEGVNDRLLDHCHVSSVPHYCAFKEQEIPRIYTVWMVIYWNSNVNILIFWDTDFWLSLVVSSNHQNMKQKNPFEVFYFICNESKIYESYKKRSYKKKFTFPIFYIPILIFWDAPVQCIFGYCYIYTPTTGFVVQGHIWSSLSVIRKDLSQLQIYCVISVIREFAAFIVWKKVKPVLFPGDVLLLWFILFSFLAPTSGENCNHCPLCHENFSSGEEVRSHTNMHP